MAIKIYIDQGHNPYNINAGAEGNGLREQDITYLVGMYLYDLLSANPNFEALTSRKYPTEILGYDNNSSVLQRRRERVSWKHIAIRDDFTHEKFSAAIFCHKGE